VCARVQNVLPWPATEPDQSLGDDVKWLVVVGGGGLIDKAKALHESRPELKLVAIPSIWGSGAEASPIIVFPRPGRKDFRVSPAARPDAVVYWPELSESVPLARQRAACGDCWSHALEGFLSPLASPGLRAELAQVIRRLLTLPLSFDPQWFELSALACAGQAMAGVGLVHGIAHTLEAPLREQQPEQNWHHAQLCSIFLKPVMRLNQIGSEKWNQLLTEYQLPEKEIWLTLRALFEPELFRAALPMLHQKWRDVLRDPCSRTNSVLVRPDWLERLESISLP
jgi:alcohol dehydrogenase class IV